MFTVSLCDIKFDAADLPRIEAPPFNKMDRETQKAQLNSLLFEAMDASDRGAHRDAVSGGKSALMMSIMLGEAPATLHAMCSSTL